LNYFFDTEFCDLGKTIEPISIGIVSGDDRRFYAEFNDYNLNISNNFLKTEVIPKLKWHGKIHINEFAYSENYTRFVYGDVKKIRVELLTFLKTESVQFWAYIAPYDFVILCYILGGMMNFPDNISHFCMDIRHEMEINNFSTKWRDRVFPKPKNAHNALDDAIWNKDFYEFLNIAKRILK
jgi:hypothetical protein